MRSRIHRTPPLRFAFVFSSSLLAAGPGLADEAAAGNGPAWRSSDAPDLPGSGSFSGFTFSWRETDDGLRPDGLFFQTADGVAVGAQGGIDLGSGNLRALVALRLDF